MNRTLIYFLFVANPAAALDKWTVDDLLKVKQIGDVAISPDGAHVLYSLSWAIPAENRRCSDLFVVSADGRETRQLTHDDAKEGAPRWIPGTRRVSYLAGDQVWSAPVAGGAPAPVTHAAAAVRSYAWSNHGRRLLYVTAEPKSPEQAAHEREWGSVISFEEQWPERTALWLLDAVGGEARRIAGGGSHPEAPAFSPDGSSVAFLDNRRLFVDGKPLASNVAFFAWSPDGSSIAYVVAREDPQPYANLFRRPVFQGSGSVWLMDARGGNSRRLTQREFRGLNRLVWSRDGRRMALMAAETMHILSTGGEVRAAATGLDLYRGAIGVAWSRDDREVWFLNGERMGFNVFAVDAATGGLRHVTAGQDCLSEVSYTPDFTSAALVRENVNTKPDIYVAALPGFQERRITDINPETRRFAHGRGEIIRYPSEGREIEALLIKPPDFNASRKYPLILVIHGGPAWAKKNEWRPEWEQHPIQAYASEGYCLVFPNVRGSTDYGADFRRANYRDLGGGDFRDAMAAVDYLIAQGFVDPDRLGVAGWSYGGYLTPAIITQTDRFKAAQFGAGIPSLEAMYSRLSTVEWLVHENYGPRPWEDARMQIQSSPLYSAWKVKTPTLIEHGEDDPRCPVGGSILFYKALKTYGVPVVLEIYPQEGHGIVGPLLRRRCLRRNLEWFNKWLKGDSTTSFEKLFPGPPPARGGARGAEPLRLGGDGLAGKVETPHFIVDMSRNLGPARGGH